MGDSDPDVDLLEAVDHAYAPANHSRAIESLAASGRCRIMRRPFQRGLLLAVEDLLARSGGSSEPRDQDSNYLPDHQVLVPLLKAADDGPVQKLFAGLKWWTL